MGKALSDFDVYDIYFSRLREEPKVDTSIVLINIGNLNREDIAYQINTINKYNPRVIGLDALFWAHKDARGDSILSDAISRTKNMVMVSKLDYYNENSDSYDSLLCSIECFSRSSKNGFANLPDDFSGSFRTIRNFKPFAKVQNQNIPSFCARIIQLVNKAAYQNLLARNKEYEMIYYRGNYNKFYYLDALDLFDDNRNFSFINNKIVLMGYMGTELSTMTVDDAFFTPMNEKYAGRSFPDMYGIVIHANIISMIFGNNYINEMPFILSVLFAVIIGYLNALIFLYVNKNLPDWSNGITKLLVFFQTILNLFIGVLAISMFSYRMTLTLAIAVVFLVPTSTDLYLNYFEKLYRYLKRIFTNRNKK